MSYIKQAMEDEIEFISNKSGMDYDTVHDIYMMCANLDQEKLGIYESVKDLTIGFVIYLMNTIAFDMAIEALQAEPVKHGKWTVDEKHTEEIYTNPVYCSVCGKDVVIDYGEYAPYCPNCGAKMDGERKTD